MDPRFLRLYEAELQHVRGSAAEFAAEFPQVAGRLGLESAECSDPYVERLLEAFAFMSARVQLKLEAEYPQFTEQLLNLVCPSYLAPTPSVAIVELQPELNEPALSTGPVVPRDATLRTALPPGEVTACEYRTAHEVRIYPLEVRALRYLPNAAAIAAAGISAPKQTRSAVILTMQVSAGLVAKQLDCDDLPLCFAARDQAPRKLQALLDQGTLAIGIRPSGDTHNVSWLDGVPIERMGTRDDEAMFPAMPQQLSSYRLLQEYFACPERLAFLRVTGLAPALASISSDRFDVVFCCDRQNDVLENALETQHVRLFCTPVVNLFPKRSDRIHIRQSTNEYAVIPDRTRPKDYEVYAVESVRGYTAGNDIAEQYLPMYKPYRNTWHDPRRSYFSVHRYSRATSDKGLRKGSRSRYVGSDVFVSLVTTDSTVDPIRVRQLEADTWCTNRDLPALLGGMANGGEFHLEQGGPIRGARAVSGPTKPRPSHLVGASTWRALSTLSYNYLSLSDTQNGDPTALRELLWLHADQNDDAMRRTIEGITAFRARDSVRRVARGGLPAHVRGVECSVTLDETVFDSAGGYLMGLVLDEVLARFASVNSYTRLTAATTDGTVIAQWPPRLGKHPLV